MGSYGAGAKNIVGLMHMRRNSVFKTIFENSCISCKKTFYSVFIMLCECGKQLSTTSALRRHKRESCIFRNVCEYLIPNKKRKVVTTTSPSSSNHSVPITFGTGKQQKNRKEVLKQLGDGVELISSAFKRRISTYRFSIKKHLINHEQFFSEIKEKVQSIISIYLNKFRNLKINFELFGTYVIPEKEVMDLKSFNTKNRVLTISTNLEEIYRDFIEEIVKKSSSLQEKDSGNLLFVSFILLR